MTKLTWTTTPEYLEATTSKFKLTNKFAWFDLDSTLIKTKSGKTFPADGDDWVFLYDVLPKEMTKISKKGYSVIIISNQSGIEKNTKKGEEWMHKLDSICDKLNIEIKVFCSTGKNKYRKPYTTFYDEFITKKQRDDCDRTESFYCGDACGRKDDHSDCDLKFALNCNLRFITPEELFLNKKVVIPEIKYPNFGTNDQYDFKLFKPQVEMLLMVGFPASGKSHFAKKLNEIFGYEIINRDTLKTKQKCVSKASELIKKKKAFIVDNTNPSKEDRAQYIKIATDNNYTVRVIHVLTSYELSMHRNNFRHLTQGFLIPELVYRIFKKNFENPELSEGIKEIINVNPTVIENPVYKKYLY